MAERNRTQHVNGRPNHNNNLNKCVQHNLINNKTDSRDPIQEDVLKACRPVADISMANESDMATKATSFKMHLDSQPWKRPWKRLHLQGIATTTTSLLKTIVKISVAQ